MSQTTCDKCAVGSAPSTVGYYVILCPLHQAAPMLLEALKTVTQFGMFDSKTAIFRDAALKEIATAEGRG